MTVSGTREEVTVVTTCGGGTADTGHPLTLHCFGVEEAPVFMGLAMIGQSFTTSPVAATRIAGSAFAPKTKFHKTTKIA